MSICMFQFRNMSHPRVVRNRKGSCGEEERKASHPFSYISQAVSSNARPSRKSKRLVMTDTQTGWKTRSHSKKQAPAWSMPKKQPKIRVDPQLLKWIARLFFARVWSISHSKSFVFLGGFLHCETVSEIEGNAFYFKPQCPELLNLAGVHRLFSLVHLIPAS